MTTVADLFLPSVQWTRTLLSRLSKSRMALRQSSSFTRSVSATHFDPHDLDADLPISVGERLPVDVLQMEVIIRLQIQDG